MKISQKITSVVISAIILSGLIVFAFSEKKVFSENENKMLSTFPDFSLSSLESGEYTLGIEEYLKDHFPLRDELVSLKTKVQILAGYKEINGTYIGQNRLFQTVPQPKSERLTNGVGKMINNVSRQNVVFSVMIVPTAAEIYNNELPEYTNLINQKETINVIFSQIDADCEFNLADRFKEEKEHGNLYYSTDHHWTTFGAYTAYTEFCKIRELDFADIDSYTVDTVASDFYGTLHSKVPNSSISPDHIEKYTLKGSSFTASFGKSREAMVSGEYYAEDYLSKKDKYAYFGNENHPIVILESSKPLNDNEILIVKDSFANAFAPFLLENYGKVHMIDPRYYVGGKISEYIDENEKISDVLVLYGFNSINDNSGITKIS